MGLIGLMGHMGLIGLMGPMGLYRLMCNHCRMVS